MLAQKIYEFQIIQITPGSTSCPTFMGINLHARALLYLQIIFCIFISPIAIGQANNGYVIAVVLLFFLRQIYLIYCAAKVVKSVQFA